jgi:hypothetical protein
VRATVRAVRRVVRAERRTARFALRAAFRACRFALAIGFLPGVTAGSLRVLSHPRGRPPYFALLDLQAVSALALGIPHRCHDLRGISSTDGASEETARLFGGGGQLSELAQPVEVMGRFPSLSRNPTLQKSRNIACLPSLRWHYLYGGSGSAGCADG